MIKKILAIVLVLLCISISAVIYDANKQVNKALAITQTSFYQLSSGTSYHHLVKDLKKKKWIDSRFPFRVFAKLNPEKTLVKMGLYQVTPGMSFYQLLENMNQGKEHQFKLTFVEGSTFSQWLESLSTAPYVKSTVNNQNVRQIMTQINPQFRHPEGLFFPDTYSYTAGTKDLDILKQAFARMQQELAQSWQNKAPDLPYDTPYEALIMASIIEKETGQVKEQPMISSVFVNRLVKGMRLQTDPTIIYGLGQRYTGDITYANIREKTPYNTYQIDGLPPTPIAMPGKAAIEATLHPLTSDYLYFVSKGNGEHHFSKTLKEHNKAVDRYIRGNK
ncbi:endolytic transglycosylase MltG [Thalassotalea aquiviva]|uniref:endolytic transglycosylase MltG n=1 Tax=Thalassotalea aquiviva TaxID=3242415 RepID=UPI003529ED92